MKKSISSQIPYFELGSRFSSGFWTWISKDRIFFCLHLSFMKLICPSVFYETHLSICPSVFYESHNREIVLVLLVQMVPRLFALVSLVSFNFIKVSFNMRKKTSLFNGGRYWIFYICFFCCWKKKILWNTSACQFRTNKFKVKNW